MRCLQVRVHGMVQGVSYRYACQREAERLNVRGWVRNCADGTVEACIVGNDDALRSMLAWLGEGPSMARVDRIVTEEGRYPDELTGFSVLPSQS